MLALRRLLSSAAVRSVPAKPAAKPVRSSVTATAVVEPKTRKWPDEPRVGVGVVALRASPRGGSSTEVLLIQRGKEPSKGLWSFPGGSLELGETMVECAEREMLEETGLRLRNVSGGIISPTLDVPTPFAAADVIERETGARDRVAFHYAIVEVAARVEDPLAPPVAAGDVDDARWVPVNELESFPDLAVNIATIALEAAARFQLHE